mmetsp:Transcript_25301/g.66167  ORF Transcript_25301/g.66167 Transcript_25301/m.66167 type:complete len:210 (-) Transcript_25301:924-1553(-)
MRRNISMLSSVVIGVSSRRVSPKSRCAVCRSCWLVTMACPAVPPGSTSHSVVVPSPASSTNSTHSDVPASHCRMASIATCSLSSLPCTTDGRWTPNSPISCRRNTTSELACSHPWSPPSSRTSAECATSAITVSLPTPGGPWISTRLPVPPSADTTMAVTTWISTWRPTISRTRLTDTVACGDGAARCSSRGDGASITTGGVQCECGSG